VDLIIQAYEGQFETCGELAKSVAIFSSYDKKAEALTREMLTSNDRELRCLAIIHSSLLSNENVELVLHALSDEDEFNRTYAIQRVKEFKPDVRIAEKLVSLLDDEGWADDWDSVSNEALEVLVNISGFEKICAERLKSYLPSWLKEEKVKDDKNRKSYKTGVHYQNNSIWDLDNMVGYFEALGDHAKVAEKEIKDVVHYLSSREPSGKGTRVMRLRNVLGVIQS